jgi:hypothetical protein
MPSKLQEICAALQTAVDAVVSGITWAAGEKSLAKHQGPARVVWVRTRDVYGPAAKSRSNPRGRRGRMSYIEAHIWGQSEENADAVQQAIALAAVEYAQGSMDVTEAKWVRDADLHRGVVCVLELAFAKDVEMPTETVALIDDVGFSNDGAVTGDGLLNTGESGET